MPIQKDHMPTNHTHTHPSSPRSWPNLHPRVKKLLSVHHPSPNTFGAISQAIHPQLLPGSRPSTAPATWPVLHQHHVRLGHADVQRLRHVRGEAVALRALRRQRQRGIQRLVAATASRADGDGMVTMALFMVADRWLKWWLVSLWWASSESKLHHWL